MLEVTLLAILQGVAEFLPVSSSGHLVIAQHLLGVAEAGMRLDVFLHAGTLVSIAVFYRRTFAKLISGRDWRYAAKIVVSALPAVAVYFCFGGVIESAFENVRTVGALLMFTGALLIGTRFLPRGGGDIGFVRALIMGCAQALALLPGVSRSGMTLVAARAAGAEPERSAEFSFLMSAPLIAGASVLEIVKAAGSEGGFFAAGEVSWALTFYGAALAAVTGYFALKLLVMTLRSRGFWLFGPYCLTAGLLTLICCGG
jgi:undecaprenyl-diphosphatase